MYRPSVFIGASDASLPFAAEVRSELRDDADVTVWCEGASAGGPSVLNSLSDAADRADLAVFILGQGDTGLSLTEPRSAVRPNLMFELGYLLGRLGPTRTLVVALGGDVVVPSDPGGPGGLNIVQFANLSHFVSPRPHSADSFWRSAVCDVIKRMLRSIGPRERLAPDFYSCFVSYSAKDQPFVDQLYEDLRHVGVPCWLDTKDLRTGARIAAQIDRAIQSQDRVMLVLSESSVRSWWVGYEINHAIALERARGGTRLFPIRLDDAVFAWEASPEADLIRSRHIADFSDWRNPKSYQHSFRRVVRDLAVTTSVESEGGGDAT